MLPLMILFFSDFFFPDIEDEITFFSGDVFYFIVTQIQIFNAAVNFFFFPDFFSDIED